MQIPERIRGYILSRRIGGWVTPVEIGEGAPDLISFVLASEARREARPGRRQKLPMSQAPSCPWPQKPMQTDPGWGMSRQGMIKHLRGSDLAERIWFSIKELIAQGETKKVACLILASKLGSRLGKYGRGRPRQSKRPRDPLDDARLVQTICDKFNRRVPLTQKEAISQLWRAAYERYMLSRAGLGPFDLPKGWDYWARTGRLPPPTISDD